MSQQVDLTSPVGNKDLLIIINKPTQLLSPNFRNCKGPQRHYHWRLEEIVLTSVSQLMYKIW